MMTTLTKVIIELCMVYVIAPHQRELKRDYKSVTTTVSATNNHLKTRAFEILTNKRNIYIIKHIRQRIFTKKTIGLWTKDIYKQVFIKNECPKARKLT